MTESTENPRRPLQAVAYHEGRQLACCVIRPGEYIIGSARKSEITINEPSISARHAKLVVGEDDELHLEDLHSANGTFIDGATVTVSTPVPPGAEVRLGAVALHFERGRLPAAAAAELPATFLRAQRYELGEVVVRGNTSTILQARDTSLGREIALRTLHPESQRDPAVVIRFVRDAKITSQLCHVGILPIYDFGLNNEGQLFFTTRFISGEPLTTILDRIAEGDSAAAGRYDLLTLVGIWQKVADVIACAHSRGVIHNSLTPDAIEVARFGEVFVTEWTFAAVIGAPGDAQPIDAPESAIPTPLTRYSAPEQAAGQFTDIDQRTDVFALGGVLYRILTLHPPLRGDTDDGLLEAALSAAVTPPHRDQPHVQFPRGRFPDFLAAVAMKALSYDPTARHQSVLELQREVAAWQSGLGGGEHDLGALWKQFTGLLHRPAEPA